MKDNLKAWNLTKGKMRNFRCSAGWLRRHYVIFESLQAGAVMGLGDLFAQKFVEKKEEIDRKRLAAFAGVGLFFVGPVTSTWYHFLDQRINSCWHPLKRGITKMLLDQALLAPVMIASVVSILELTNGSGTWEGVRSELDKKYTTILTNNYKVWPAVQTINFSFVPVSFQVLVAQTFGVAWNTYLSYAKNSKAEHTPSLEIPRIGGSKDKPKESSKGSISRESSSEPKEEKKEEKKASKSE